MTLPNGDSFRDVGLLVVERARWITPPPAGWSRGLCGPIRLLVCATWGFDWLACILLCYIGSSLWIVRYRYKVIRLHLAFSFVIFKLITLQWNKRVCKQCWKIDDCCVVLSFRLLLIFRFWPSEKPFNLWYLLLHWNKFLVFKISTVFLAS